MSQKTPKPTLTGQRLKTRKRDEKEKYDPIGFRDAVILGIYDASDLDQLAKFLDTAGSRLNYRRYADVLFDILFAGGILAPGGGLIEDEKARCELCVFLADNDLDAMKAWAQ
ncbi:protein krasavietz-like, partial [Saccoglossus kowalevskii]|uniref:Protein extra bases-like n=1 Tax=Saccoglossus kowalevskii TaxID=10224 RepID=A0ABM0N086_SACKO